LNESTSTARIVSEFASKDNGVYQIYFDFENAEMWLKPNVTYCAGLVASGYTFSESSHLGWVRDWPVSMYPDNFTPTKVNLAVAPLRFMVFGQEFAS